MPYSSHNYGSKPQSKKGVGVCCPNLKLRTSLQLIY